MASKSVAVFLMCVVVVAAMHVQEATGEVFKKCYEVCQKDCQVAGNGYTFCEMKCDTECGAKEAAAKLEKFKNEQH